MNKFEKEQSMALMVGDDLSRPCHSSGKLLATKIIKVRKESAAELFERLGFKPLTQEQKDANLTYNLSFFD